jgi:hypothetical protein
MGKSALIDVLKAIGDGLYPNRGVLAAQNHKSIIEFVPHVFGDTLFLHSSNF